MIEAPGTDNSARSAFARVKSLPLFLKTRLKARWKALALIAAAAVVFLAANYTLLRSHRPKPTNIILITVDCLRADVLGCYGFKTGVAGQPATLSPNIDRIARDGVLFERAYSQSDRTGPSMASMLYSQRPAPTSSDDYSYISAWANFLACLRNMENEAGGFKLRAYISNAVLTNALFTSNFDRVSFFLSPHYKNGDTPYPYSTLMHERCETILSSLKTSILAARRAGDPTPTNRFTWVHLMDLHEPWAPPQKWRSLFPEPVANFSDVNSAFLAGNRDDATMEGIRSARADYYASLLYLDQEIGKWYDWAASEGILDDTLVIITADHGQAFGEHGAFLHETWMGNEEVHVPYIVVGNDPRASSPVPKGARVSAVVSSSLDTLPTIAELWGFGTRRMQGTSLADLIEEPDAPAGPRPAAYSCRGPTMRGGNNNLERYSLQDGAIFVRKTDLASGAVEEQLYNGNLDYSMSSKITDPAMLADARRECIKASLHPALAPLRKGPTLDPVTRQRLMSLGYVNAAPRTPAAARTSLP